MKTIEYYMNLPYRLELVPDTEEGGFVASYPELRGCLTSGETAEAALKNRYRQVFLAHPVKNFEKQE